MEKRSSGKMKRDIETRKIRHPYCGLTKGGKSVDEWSFGGTYSKRDEEKATRHDEDGCKGRQKAREE